MTFINVNNDCFNEINSKNILAVILHGEYSFSIGAAKIATSGQAEDIPVNISKVVLKKAIDLNWADADKVNMASPLHIFNYLKSIHADLLDESPVTVIEFSKI